MAILNQTPTKTIPLSKTKYTKNLSYQLNAPVQVVGYFIYKETDINNAIYNKKVSFGFKNESDQKIIAIKGKFQQKDPFGDDLGDIAYSIIELENFTPGSIQGETFFTDCNISTITIQFRIDQVIFEDGSKWSTEIYEFIPIDIEKKMVNDSELPALKYAWQLETAQNPLKNYYSENEHFYVCPCGNINRITSDHCSVCKTPKANAKLFETVAVAQSVIQKMTKEVFNKFNELFPDALIFDSNGSLRLNENAVLFDPEALKKLRNYATYWKGVNPLIKDEIKANTEFVKFIEGLRTQLLKTENEQQLKVEKQTKLKVKKQRNRLLVITLSAILLLALIGLGIYWFIFGNLAFENRNSYEAEVTFTFIDMTHTQIDVVIDDINLEGSKFEFWGIVFDQRTCRRPYCYDEIILSPEYWDITIIANRFVATTIVNLPINGMKLDIQYLEFNSPLFTKHIYVDRNNLVYIEEQRGE